MKNSTQGAKIFEIPINNIYIINYISFQKLSDTSAKP